MKIYSTMYCTELYSGGLLSLLPLFSEFSSTPRYSTGRHIYRSARFRVLPSTPAILTGVFVVFLSLSRKKCVSMLIFTVTAGLSEGRGRPMTLGTRVRPNAMLMCLRPCINIDLYRAFGLSGNPTYSLLTYLLHGAESFLRS